MKWHFLSPQHISTLADLRQVLLNNRGLTPSDEFLFFEPPDPLNISTSTVGIDNHQLSEAIDRLNFAKDNQQKVVIFGDYDADGITATAIMWLSLVHFGIKAMPFIPHREKHGYGMSAKALDEIIGALEKPDLIITVDNGIVAFEAAERLKQEGVELIITDHHQPELTLEGKVVLPPALSVVHSTQLCGATVAWMVSRELDAEFSESLLDLAGIGTIADQVPLLSANRSFARYGLEALRNTTRPGIVALLNQASIEQTQLTESSINFALAPRINAMGRLEHGLDALRLLCTNQLTKAKELAQKLAEVNIRRQDLTQSLLSDARLQAQDWSDEHIIMVSSHAYHEGIIGLIAGRLSEEFHKPAIAVHLGETIAKASARSVPGVNIVQLLREIRSELLAVGGHPMAAGFGFNSNQLEQVATALKKVAKTNIDQAFLYPQLTIEAVVPSALFQASLVNEINSFAPFGAGNPEPLIALEQLKLLDVFPLGNQGKHLKFLLEDDQGMTFSGLAWQWGERQAEFEPGNMVTVVGIPQLNNWKGKSTIQLIIKDLARSSSF